MKSNIKLIFPITLAITLSVPKSANAISDTLLYLKCNENIGIITNDISGRGNNAIVQGMTVRGNGVEGKSLHFDSSQDFAATINPIALNKNAFTIAAWVYHNTIVPNIERYVSIQSEKAVIRHEGNGFISAFFVDNLGVVHQTISDQPLLATSTWQHVAATWDGQNLRLYFNGMLQKKLLTPSTINYQTAGAAYISWPGEGLTNGNIDEAIVYDDALSPKQIERVFRFPFIQPTVIDNGLDIIIAQAVITKSPYEADTTGIIDCTAAFQKAINEVQSAGGGIIYVPEGIYRLDGHLTLGTNVILSGKWSSPKNGGLGSGTILKAYESKGNSNGSPFINLLSDYNAGISNISIWYPEQDALNLYPYPWTIRGGTGSSIKNVTLYNSYNGIYLNSATATTMQNIYACAINKGIEAPYSEDISWGYNINFSSLFWSNAPFPITNAPVGTNAINLSNHIKNNLVAMQYGTMDGYALYGVDGTESKIALLFKKDSALLAGVNPIRLTDEPGFGGLVGKIKGNIIHNKWNSWHYSVPTINTDNINETLNKDYLLAPVYNSIHHSPKDMINVLSFGAVGDGLADDTQAFLDALVASNILGGGIVYFPQGRFKISQPIVVPFGTEVRGALGAVPARLLLPERETTTLLCYTGSNTASPEMDQAFITLSSNSGLRGLNITYPMQSINAIPYPYTVRGQGSHIWLKDFFVADAYNMVDFASFPCNDFVISGLMGFGMKKGINIGGGTLGGNLEFIGATSGASLLGVGRLALHNYSYFNTVHYLFGNCSGIRAFGLTGWDPLIDISFYQQNGIGCSNSDFWHSIFDSANDAAIKLGGGTNNNFYGIWSLGGGGLSGSGGDPLSNWLEATPTFSGKNNIYAPSFIHHFLKQPLNAFNINSSTINIKREYSLSTNKKIAFHSGTFDRGLPGLALDDNIFTYWKATPGGELVVNLGSNYRIDRISILNAGLFDFDKYYNTQDISLWYSLDGNNFVPVTSPMSDVSYVSSFTNELNKFQMDFPIDTVVAKYVKLKVINGTDPTRDNVVRIRSFDVFGTPVSSIYTPRFSEGVKINTVDKNISISPNPTTGVFDITSEFSINQKIKIELSDVIGNIVKRWEFPELNSNQHLRLNISTLDNGVYILNTRFGMFKQIERIIKN